MCDSCFICFSKMVNTPDGSWPERVDLMNGFTRIARLPSGSDEQHGWQESGQIPDRNWNRELVGKKLYAKWRRYSGHDANDTASNANQYCLKQKLVQYPFS